MSTNTTAGFLGVGAFILILGFGLAYAVEMDGPGLTGMGIGALLGTINLVVGLWLTSRAIRRDSNALLRTMIGGFIARFFLLAILIVVFHSTPAVDEIGFGLTFLMFFMLFMGFEVRLVDKDLKSRAAQRETLKDDAQRRTA